VRLTGLKSEYRFDFQVGNLTMKFLKFSDTKGGACLNSFIYEFTPSEELEVETGFSSASQMLALATDRTDLPTI
jgi:hypothetical protein